MQFDLVPLSNTSSFDLVPFDDEETKKEVTSFDLVAAEPKRESQHMKQFVAGALDIGASLPALAGLVATPFKAGYHALADDTGLKESFVKGLDNPAMRLAGKMQQGINDLVGVEDPQGLEQLTRLLPSMIPTPFALSRLVTKGAGAASKALNITSAGGQKAMEFGAQLALPMVQTTKGASLGRKAAEVGAQAGLTLGGDQGIRYAMDMPTIASSYDLIDDSLLEDGPKTAISAGIVVAGALFARQVFSQRAAAQAKMAEKLGTYGTNSAPINPEAKPGALNILDTNDAKFFDAHSVIRKEVVEKTGNKDEGDEVLGLWKQRAQEMAAANMVRGNFPNSAVETGLDNTLAKIDETYRGFDEANKKDFDDYVHSMYELPNRIKATMRNLELGEDNAASRNKFVEKQITDINVFANKLKGEIKNAEDVIAAGGKSTRQHEKFIKNTQRKLKTLENSLNRWNNFGSEDTVTGFDGKVWRLSDDVNTGEVSIFNKTIPLDQQLSFLKSIGAKRTATGLAVGTREGKLLTPQIDGNFALATEVQMQHAIAKGKKNPQVQALAERYSKLGDSFIEFFVEQGLWSKPFAAEMRRDRTFHNTFMFTPGREANATDVTAIGRIKYILGWDTPEALAATQSLLNRAGGVYARAKETLNSAAGQAAEEAANFKGSMPGQLKQSAQKDVQGIISPMNPIAAMESYTASLFEHVSENTARVRTANILREGISPNMIVDKNTPDSKIIVKLATFDPQTGDMIKGSMDPEIESAVKTRAGTGNIKDIEQENMLYAYEDGVQVQYYVPSKIMRDAMTYHSNIVQGMHVIGATAKNVMTAGTTRHIAFAPLQSAYATMMQFVNAPASGIFFHLGDTIRGTKEALVTGFAQETAGHFRRLMKTSTFFQNNKPLFEKLTLKLENIVQKSMMLELQNLTGGVQGSTLAIDSVTRTAKTLDSLMGAARMPGDAASYNAVKGVWRYGSILNRAIQDGATIGLYMKAMRQQLKKDYRTISRPSEIDGVKIVYKSPTHTRADGTVPTASYNRGTNTIHIDVDRVKKESFTKTQKDGWQADKAAYENMPKHFDDADDFAEFVLDHELAHARQNQGPKGMVRLYRGETSVSNDVSNVPDWIRESPAFQSTMSAHGRWFTRSPDEARHYNSMHGADDGNISYIDVPEKEVDNYLSKNQPEAKRFSAAGRENEEYFLPRELADRRVRVNEGVPREIEANHLATMARNKARARAANIANVRTKDIAGDYLAQGTDEFTKAARAWTPFMGAAMQGMRAFGRAWSRDPVKTATMLTTAVVIPAVAEQVFLYSSASEEQKEAFWKESDSVRVANMMMPHPDGKTLIKIPVEPVMRVFRAMAVEMVDTMLNGSNQYRPYKNELTDGVGLVEGQFMYSTLTGLASAVNLPISPLIQAMAAKMGYQVVVGIDPNSESGFGGIRPLAGQQVSAIGRDQNAMINGVLTKESTGMMAALGGMMGQLVGSVYELFNVGTESDLEERADRAFEEVTHKFAAYSRVGALFGLDETTRNTRASALDAQLRPMIRGLNSARMMAAGQKLLAGGQVPAGNALLSPDDPVTMINARNMASVADNVRFKDAGTTISLAYQQLKIIDSSDRTPQSLTQLLPWLPSGEPFTREMKFRATQELNAKINQERVMQLYLMKQNEEIFGGKYSDYAGTSPPIHLDSPFAYPSGMFEESASYIPTPEAPPSQ